MQIQVTYIGGCGCPVGRDCDHGSARPAAQAWPDANNAELIARKPPSAWEIALSDLVAPKAPQGSELALQFSGQLNGTALAHVQVRPMARGKTGWIKTGASWRDIEYGYSRIGAARAQREVVLELLAMFRARQPRYHYSFYGDPKVRLDDLGPGVWQLLREAQQRGIALIGAPGNPVIRLATEPAGAVLDLRRRADADHVRMVGKIRLADGAALPGDGLLVGDPAHGVAFVRDGELVLSPLDQPIDEATSRVLAAGRSTIPVAEMTRFVTSYYPALRRHLTVVSSDDTVDLPDVEPPRLVLDVSFGADHTTALRWSFCYRIGDLETRFDLAQDGSASRDAVCEQALLSRLGVLDAIAGLRVAAAGDYLLPATRLAGLQTAIFVDRVLPGLVADDTVTVNIHGEPAAYRQAHDAPVIAVSTGDTANSDWFDLDVTVSVDGQQVPFAALISALTLGEENLLLESGTWFRIDRPELARLRELIEEARSIEDKPGTGPLRLSPVQAGLWEELVSLGVVARQSERWTRQAGALLSFTEMPRPAPPSGLLAELRPYQLDGYQWLSLLWDLRLGGVLADDMGLGKTVQTLAMAARAADAGTLGGQAGPLLIVAPTSVVATWQEQSAAFCPALRVEMIIETERRSGRPIGTAAARADVMITSFALFRIDYDSYAQVQWCGLVLDEAQFVKNHQAKTYQCARQLPAAFKLAITGTPLENSLMDLWSMLSITAPGLFPNPARFNELYRRPIESGSKPEQLDALRRRVRPLMLRRTKGQVAADLPPKLEQVLHLSLNPAQRRIYDTHLTRERQRVLGLVDDFNRNRIAILRSLTVLRQLALDASLVDERHAGKVRSSKIDLLVDQLREVAAEGHRALVFSQFTRFLSLVRTRLNDEGIETCYLDGRTRDRPRRIAAFTDGDAPVFLISLKAGGFGLNLTAADYVFVLDPWWNPATEAQAIDRAHRIGQTRKVMVYRLVASDTIEEKVVALQERKRELFARVIDGGAAASTVLTADDIRGLFER